MGFMDKAKKMAEQAQAKIDEAQKQFNAGQQQDQTSGPAVEYDQHGRPVAQAPQESVAPPHGDPLAEQSTPAAPPATSAAPPQGDPLAGESMPPATPGVPPTTQDAAGADAPQAPAARPEADAPDEDRNKPSYAPPKLSSGDPLAG
jgi:hypothetical protein